jgi:hypothetical protein
VRLNEPTPIGTVYTLPSIYIPSDDPEIIAKTAEITGRERSPHLKAQKIYEWLITSGNIRLAPLAGGAMEALREKQADSYSASLLFCAMARSAGIPALPVAGVLVNRFMGTVRHYWAEFWLDGFGWIPVDPVMGAGAVTVESMAMESEEEYYDPAGFYFGNIDNMRIAFSRGELVLSQMENHGRLVSHNQSYSLQNIWEEASGGLESYSSL